MQKGFYNLAELNCALEKDVNKVIIEAEKAYEKQLEMAAEFVVKNKKTKIILIAGGSCVGKTTTANIFAEELKKYGKTVLTVAIDNFFIDRKKRPILPDGTIDFDSLEIVDLNLMSECFKTLFKTGKAMFPEYDFVNGINTKNKIPYAIDGDTIIIVEGIHAFNPRLISHLETKDIVKVYVNNNYGYELNGEQISARDFRLVRRIVRDMARRKTSPAETFEQWGNVCEAEKKYIMPYIKSADISINSSHRYEIGLYKKCILDAAKNGLIDAEKYPWVSIFKNAREVNKALLPKEKTLMKEFIDL